MKKKTRDTEESTRKNDNDIVDYKENRDKPEKDSKAKDSDNKNGAAADNNSDVNGADIKTSDKVDVEGKAVEAKLAEMQDRYIRLSAEFDNYRKRTLREKIELSKYAGEDMLLRIIPVIDDFERALMHMENSDDRSSVKAGVDLIYNKFSEFLKSNGVKEIPSLNCDFDVDVHEAVGKIPVDDDTLKGKVVDVVLKGYFLQDKVLRFSKVIVGE